MLEIFAYRTVTLVYLTGQNWILKPRIVSGVWWSVKLVLHNETQKLHFSMVVTYYIKLFWTGADRHKGIWMSLLLLAAETKIFNLISSY